MPSDDSYGDLLARFSGGDRRSTGEADAVAEDVEHGTVSAAHLVAAMASSADAVVRMRAADALEKATRAHPELLAPVREELLGLLETATQQELRWHLAQMTPRLSLTKAQKERAVASLKGYLDDPSSIVKTEALDALVALATADGRLAREVLPLLEEAIDSGTPAMRARARRLREGQASTPRE